MQDNEIKQKENDKSFGSYAEHMNDWRTAKTIEEFLMHFSKSTEYRRIDKITEDLYLIDQFDIANIIRLNQFDHEIGERVLQVLLEWACYSQNVLCIEMGRKCISFISKDWLKTHIVNTVKNYFDFQDDWNYRRLLELVKQEIPEMIPAMIDINKTSTNPDILECIEDFNQINISGDFL